MSRKRDKYKGKLFSIIYQEKDESSRRTTIIYAGGIDLKKAKQERLYLVNRHRRYEFRIIKIKDGELCRNKDKFPEGIKYYE